jgi:hypothetical protein
MLNESRNIYTVMVLVLEEWWQQTDRINGMSFSEIMKVQGLSANVWLNENL